MFLAVVSQPTHFLYTAAQKGVRSGQEGKQERGWLGRTRALQALLSAHRWIQKWAVRKLSEEPSVIWEANHFSNLNVCMNLLKTL